MDEDNRQTLKHRNTELERRLAELEREVQTLRSFREAIWQRAVDDLERWARAEGLGGEPIGPPPLPAERRAADRAAVDHPVRVALPERAQTFVAALVDLSETGLRVQSDLAPEPGALVACGLYLSADDVDHLVLLRGTVVRHTGPAEGPPGFALTIEQANVDLGWLVEQLAPLQITASSFEREEVTLKYGARLAS